MAQKRPPNRSGRINVSIISVMVILASVLVGILFYGHDVLKREMFNYGWQLSRNVHSGIAQAGRREFAAFETANDSLISAFLDRNGAAIDSGRLDRDSAIRLIQEHKQIYLHYFHDPDSVKALLEQSGMDSAVGLRVEIGFFSLNYHHRDLVPLFNSLLRRDSLLRTIYSDFSGRDHTFFTRGIRIRGEHFRVDYRAAVHPIHLRGDLIRRVTPIFIFLLLAFLAMGFFSAFTIRTMLRQQRISDLKTDFINNITHEFNTPLATIAVATKMLQDVGQDSEKVRDLSGMIDRQNHILQQMVSTITQFSEGAPESQGEIPLMQPVGEIRKIISEFEVVNKEQQLEIHSRLEINPQATIRMDPSIFSNMLNNVLDNALKYRDPSRTSVITMVAVSMDHILEISVNDNGMGMKKDQLRYIFEKFYRVPSGDLHNVKGMGLGLYFVKKNVDGVGGSVRVESKEGQGSTFIFRFPLVQI
ncbi:MAG TPA: HAMP domain-containing sensor histidine kinase [Chitinophagaceae bacterium]|nr:HAMP domain-containing sensor histidine kinase [Chitinophagaceae bacterium]